ncbi:hypothetical protein [Paenibacillus cucumis (ex Kampfer et al. 2016)]|uniref:Uncharacterized protein n=1 Tax=Paenibacillus cucumis (ex Kampfer et al. 2016) TaxID=1776858 RepID=A0ABS7KHK9_9BACL|nr:hypothetical protein [Paenibacillus cucumis (ex Kampfer et al. 2016)]MBY0203649.1 hypothetical protein [Paenibacillus cucumis (ex Kampfer et al. 2016)]
MDAQWLKKMEERLAIRADQHRLSGYEQMSEKNTTQSPAPRGEAGLSFLYF